MRLLMDDCYVPRAKQAGTDWPDETAPVSLKQLRAGKPVVARVTKTWHDDAPLGLGDRTGGTVTTKLSWTVRMTPQRTAKRRGAEPHAGGARTLVARGEPSG